MEKIDYNFEHLPYLDRLVDIVGNGLNIITHLNKWIIWALETGDTKAALIQSKLLQDVIDERCKLYKQEILDKPPVEVIECKKDMKKLMEGILSMKQI